MARLTAPFPIQQETNKVAQLENRVRRLEKRLNDMAQILRQSSDPTLRRAGIRGGP